MSFAESLDKRTHRKTKAAAEFHHMGAQNENANEERECVAKEAKVNGVAGLFVLFRYLKVGTCWPIILLFALGSITVQLISSGVDYWLSYWTREEQLRAVMMPNQSIWDFNTSVSDTSPVDGPLDTKTSSYIYIGLVMGLIVGVFLRLNSLYAVCLNCSCVLHNTMLRAIIRTPMKFFEIQPIGRILNRFSRDIGQVDEILPPQLADAVNITLAVLGAMGLVVAVNLWLLIPSLMVLIIYLLLYTLYAPSLCNVKRLEAVTRSPVFTHLSTSLQGLTTVRAFGAQKRFMDQFDEHQNLHTSAWFTYLCLRRWFCMQLDLTSSTYISIVTLSFMFISEWLGSHVGLAITSAMSLSLTVMWCLRQVTEVQNQMTSVERLLEFCDLQPEAPLKIKDKTPRDDWPQHGVIAFTNVSLKYSEHAPAVLKNFTFYIKGGEKIGIVGRTGAGKSSLVSSLYRLTEPSGDITIDGVCIGELGLHDLRGRLSIIPQEPTIFTDTIRKNLDPMNQKQDHELWNVLEEVRLKEVVQEMQGGLEADLSEGGSNLSMGQRQLLCLARAILKQNKILILDEASANVDLRTDEMIQDSIRNKFKYCTVLTVAHRLQTIIDCDRIMVLHAGQLVEFEEPYVLLMNKKSLFTSLVEQTNPGTAHQLRRMAELAYLRRRGTLEKL